jgi:hypothetical protein
MKREVAAFCECQELLGRGFRVGEYISNFLKVGHGAPAVPRYRSTSSLSFAVKFGFIEVCFNMCDARLICCVKVPAAQFQLFVGFDFLCTSPWLQSCTYTRILDNGFAVQSREQRVRGHIKEAAQGEQAYCSHQFPIVRAGSAWDLGDAYESGGWTCMNNKG